MQIHYEFFTLKNGLKVLLIPSDTVYSVQVSGTVLIGSAAEPVDKAGILHFIEHAASSENSKYPDPEKYEEEKELRGGVDNAYTSKEELKYYITVPFSEITFALDLVTNTIFNSLISTQSVERQRKIILDEISKADDDVNWQNVNFIWDAICSKKSGYSHKISGTSEQIQKYSRDEIYEFYKTSHQPKNVLLSIAGNFKKSDIEDYLSKLEEIENTQNQILLPDEEIAKNLRIDKPYHKTDLLYTTLVFDIPRLNSLEKKEELALKFVFTVLCGPLTSRLVRRLRERENLLYSIEQRISSHKTFASIKILWESPPEIHQKIYNIVLEELTRLFDQGVTEEELVRYKKFVTNRSLIRYDDIYEITDLVENQIIHDMPIEPDIKVLNKIIEDFNLEYINSIIKKYKYILDGMTVLRFGKF